MLSVDIGNFISYQKMECLPSKEAHNLKFLLEQHATTPSSTIKVGIDYEVCYRQGSSNTVIISMLIVIFKVMMLHTVLVIINYYDCFVQAYIMNFVLINYTLYCLEI